MIRSAAIRKIHEREKIDKNELKEILLNVIQNDRDNFPRQIALSIILLYADKDAYNALRRVYSGEKMFKMKKFIFRTIEEVAEKLDIELDIYEPVEDVTEKNSKKKKKRRKKKKGKEEHLFF